MKQRGKEGRLGRKILDLNTVRRKAIRGSSVSKEWASFMFMPLSAGNNPWKHVVGKKVLVILDHSSWGHEPAMFSAARDPGAHSHGCPRDHTC